MGHRLRADIPPRHVTSYPGQLNMAIPPWVVTMSTGDGSVTAMEETASSACVTVSHITRTAGILIFGRMLTNNPRWLKVPQKGVNSLATDILEVYAKSSSFFFFFYPDRRYTSFIQSRPTEILHIMMSNFANSQRSLDYGLSPFCVPSVECCVRHWYKIRLLTSL